MTSAALKLYTAVIAIVCAAAIAWSINQTTAAATWQSQASQWETVARRTVAHDRHTVRRYRMLAHRYNQLVVDTQRSQKRLLANLQTVQPTAVQPAPSIPAPTTAPVATASAPTTHTS